MYIQKFAEAFNKALNFRIGTVGDILEGNDTEYHSPLNDRLADIDLSGGAIDDYYLGYWGIDLAYTLELDPHIDKHGIGFKLPPTLIKSNGKH